MNDVVSKSAFAVIAGVSRVRVSQWLSEGKISGDAIVGTGRHARIRVAAAMEQLKRNLDPVQHLGANGRAMLDGNDNTPPDTVEAAIKAERLRQLLLSNAKAEAEAAVRSGRYTRTDAARQELGRVAARLLAVFEASFVEFGNAIVSERPATTKDAVRVLRTTWRAIRVRQSKAVRNNADVIPPLEDGEDRQQERVNAGRERASVGP
jgi:hypothetical protein